MTERIIPIVYEPDVNKSPKTIIHQIDTNRANRRRDENSKFFDNQQQPTKILIDSNNDKVDQSNRSYHNNNNNNNNNMNGGNDEAVSQRLNDNGTVPPMADIKGFEWIKLNCDYFRTLPGLLKIIELILSLICISLASPIQQHVTYWFILAIVFIFIATLIWTFVYLLSIREAIRLPIDWILSELFNTLLSTILYFIVSIVQIIISIFSIFSSGQLLSLVVGIIGLVNSFVYLYSTFLLQKEWKSLNRF